MAKTYTKNTKYVSAKTQMPSKLDFKSTKNILIIAGIIIIIILGISLLRALLALIPLVIIGIGAYIIIKLIKYKSE